MPYIVGSYPSITHKAVFRALKELLDRREEKKISSEHLFKMAVFVLKNNYFQFNGQVKHQIWGRTVGTKICTFICIHLHG